MRVDTDIVQRLRHAVASDPQLATNPSALVRRVRDEVGIVSDEDVLAILRQLRDDTEGLGPLETIAAIPGVTDIVVNGPGQVFFDRGDGLERADLTFASDAEVRRLATRLAMASGSRLDDAQPFADGRINRPDGSCLRIHALLSPPAESGTCISVRVLRQATTTLDDLVSNGSVEPDIAHVLRTLVRRKVSMLVIGGTGSGKTTLLSALMGQVADSERILIIEDTAELRPVHPHCVTMVSRRANTEGQGEITMSQLLRQALRMRPDRIIVGEIRGAEVVDLLAALNTGHDGGAGTLHANALEEVPARLEALAALGGLDRVGLHSQLAAAVDVVLTMERTSDGRRRLAQIGVLSGNPVSARPVWTAADGRLDGFAELVGVVQS